MYASQVVNAVLLPLHAIALQLLASDPKIMGESKSGKLTLASGWFGVVLIVTCIGALAVSWSMSR